MTTSPPVSVPPSRKRALVVALTLVLACQSWAGPAGSSEDPANPERRAQAAAQGALHAARTQRAGQALWGALDAADLPAAITAGREAVQLAPAHAPYRIALVHALLRDGRFDEAERIAGEAPAQGNNDLSLQMLRALALSSIGPADAARAQAASALALPPRAAGEARSATLIAADLALASGSPADALAILRSLALSDPGAAARRDWARHLHMTGTSLSTAAVLPALDCGALAGVGSCLLLPRALPQLPGYGDAAAAYAALRAGDAGIALERARAATASAPAQREWRLLHVQSAVAAGDLAEADAVASHVIASDTTADAQLVAQRSWIRKSLGDTAGAERDAATALGSGALPPVGEAVLLLQAGRHADARERLLLAASGPMTRDERLQLAYLQVQARDDAQALRAFRQAEEEGALTPASLHDAGYAALRAHEDAQALAFFDRAVLAQVRPVSAAQRVHDTKVMSAEVERAWGVLSSITYRNGAGVAPGFGVTAPGSDGRTTQAGIEGFWRPFGYRNGRYVEVFARGFETIDAPSGVWRGWDSFQGTFGVRWKPWTEHNIVLSLGRVFGPNVQDSWLAQVAYSLDNGTGLRLDVPSWWTSRFYAEAGRYFGGGTRAGSYAVAMGSLGRSFPIDDAKRTVAYPHLFAGVEHQSRDPSARTSAGVGAGVSVRHWFREDETRGPRSSWEFTAQYRIRVAGDDRMKGPYVSATMSF